MGRLVSVVSWVVRVGPVRLLCVGVGQGWISIGEYQTGVVQLMAAARWWSGTRRQAGRGT